jgi:hypothetical protein
LVRGWVDPEAAISRFSPFSRLRAIDGVVARGAPTDVSLYQQEAGASADGRLKLVAHAAASRCVKLTVRVAGRCRVILSKR